MAREQESEFDREWVIRETTTVSPPPRNLKQFQQFMGVFFVCASGRIRAVKLLCGDLLVKESGQWRWISRFCFRSPLCSFEAHTSQLCATSHSLPPFVFSHYPGLAEMKLLRAWKHRTFEQFPDFSLAVGGNFESQLFRLWEQSSGKLIGDELNQLIGYCL
jgi:hypothetical protein